MFATYDIVDPTTSTRHDTVWARFLRQRIDTIRKREDDEAFWLTAEVMLEIWVHRAEICTVQEHLQPSPQLAPENEANDAERCETIRVLKILLEHIPVQHHDEVRQLLATCSSAARRAEALRTRVGLEIGEVAITARCSTLP